MSGADKDSQQVTVHIEDVSSEFSAVHEFMLLVKGSSSFSGKLPMLVENGLCIGLTGTGPLGVENAKRIAAALNAERSSCAPIPLIKRISEQRDGLYDAALTLLAYCDATSDGETSFEQAVIALRAAVAAVTSYTERLNNIFAAVADDAPLPESETITKAVADPSKPVSAVCALEGCQHFAPVSANAPYQLPFAPEDALRRMHEAVKQFAPQFGLEHWASEWEDLPQAERDCMVAVIRNVFIEQASRSAIAPISK